MWNAFVDLLSREEYEALSPVQRPAQLAFLYQSEVMNGGHYQYFLNSTGMRSRETVDALGQLGLPCNADLLREAIQMWSSKERRPVVTSEDFRRGAMEREFEKHDRLLEECSPTIDEGLQVYLKEHQSEFVTLENGNGVGQ